MGIINFIADHTDYGRVKSTSCIRVSDCGRYYFVDTEVDLVFADMAVPIIDFGAVKQER